MAFKDYDVKIAFARIEDELISSMMRNLGRHLKEEEDEEFDWSQWQVEQLKYLQEYRLRNKKEYGPRFQSINEKIEEAIRDAHQNGQKDEEINILEAISKDKRIRPRRANPSAASVEGAGDAFFRVNDRKLEALVEAAHNDMEKAEQAVLRRTNDQYRKIIFDAQMYANTGAGTVEKAVDMATKDFLMRGIDSIQYKNGARHTISDYADMYIRTAEKRAYLMGEGKKRQEWGEQLVIVNRRGTMSGGNYGHACPKCIPWLGKILIDDVYSEGKPDGKHQLLSDAMAAGFLHPRCKDSFSTYIPGVSPQEDPVTKQEMKKAVEAEAQEQREQLAERQEEKFTRLARNSLDPENKRIYGERAEKWEMLRTINRVKAEDGHVIIDDRTYKKLTETFLKNDGLIIRGEEAKRHLEIMNAYAAYLPGLNAAYIRDDATVSDVLEEMYHAEQDRMHMFGVIMDEEVRLRREIDAQKYLLRMTKRYKIPLEEMKVTKQNLIDYERMLKEFLKGR